MQFNELYELLELPEEVRQALGQYEKIRSYEPDETLTKNLLCRETWDEAVKDLRESLGEDPDGIRILYEMLAIVWKDSYKEYIKRGIEKEIFVDTMKFVARFLNEHKRVYGTYRFVWDWWFPRQMALQEFRIGALEYELVDTSEPVISIHIPSDADMSPDSITDSLNHFRDFLELHFPKWRDVRYCCDSWMLSPSLPKLLNSDSNILNFQRRFEVENTNWDSLAVLDWVFPGYREVSAELPEKTSLQRSMKAYLLSGEKVGWSKGYMK